MPLSSPSSPTSSLSLPLLCYRAPQARVLRLIQAWNLSLPDTPLSAVFSPRYAESAVDRYLRVVLGCTMLQWVLRMMLARFTAAPALLTVPPCFLITRILLPCPRGRLFFACAFVLVSNSSRASAGFTLSLRGRGNQVCQEAMADSVD